MLKTCKTCGIAKPREEFYKLKGKQYKPHWDVRDGYCIECKKKNNNQKRQELKKQAVLYKGGKCVDCSIESPHICIYDFHHLDPSKKDFSFANIGHRPFSKWIPELDKCVLLCSNCHRIRHYT